MSERLQNFGAALVVVILGFVIYANVLHGEFQFDDVDFIVQSESIRDITNFKGIWFEFGHPSRVVALYTFALNYHFHQYDVFGYHLVNIFIHICAALLVSWLIFLLLALTQFKQIRRFYIAWFAALLFLVHPLQTEAVSYVCQRYASLATLFYLLTLCLYIRARMSTVWSKLFFAGALVSAILAMFTKQISFTMPIIIGLLELYFLQPRGFLKQWNARMTMAVLGLLVFMCIVPSFFAFDVKYVLLSELPSRSNSDDVLTSFTYFLTQPRVILTYLKLLFIPLGQTLDYDFPLSQTFWHLPTLLSFMVLISVFISAIVLFKKNRLVSFGLVWMFVTMSVESSIIPIPHVIFEHRMYLPMVGIVLVLSLALDAMMKSRKKFIVTVILIVLVLSYLTVHRNVVWKDSLTMWTDALAKAPNKPRPYHNLGFIHLERGNYDLAIDHFNQALEKEPRYFQAYHNRGDAYSQIKRYEDAIADYNRALQLNSRSYNILVNRGNAYRNSNRLELAIQDYDRALEIYPANYLAYNSRGVAFQQLGHFERAIQDFTQAIELKPDYDRAYNNRGAVYGLTQRYDQAILDFTQTLRLNSEFVEAYYNRSRAYLLTGDILEAQKDAREALNRNYPIPKNYLQKLKILYNYDSI